MNKIDSILKVVTTAVNKLEQYKADKYREHGKLADKASKLEDQAEAAALEAKRAQRVAEKLKALVE